MKAIIQISLHIILISTSINVWAQFKLPAPLRITPSPLREARYAAGVARDVVETVQDVNEVVDAVNDARKNIDTLIADDKSSTPGLVHFILIGVDSTHESIQQLHEALGNISSISNMTIKRSTKTGCIVLEFNSEVVPMYTWQRLPAKVQKYYFVHSKDASNVVLLYKVAPKKP